jgi:alkylation response protein AidB-like acyl-CoA dehydrogenase
VTTVDDLNRQAQEVLPQIAEGAAERERHRELPYEQIRQIARLGLLTFRVPREYGGPGGTIAGTIQFVVNVAAVDANIAQSLRPAFLFTEGLLAADSQEWRQRWLPRVLNGDVFGTGGWERGGANGEIRARITPDGQNFRVNGTKSYSTGALFADWISSTALNSEGDVVAFTVPHDREGLKLLDDWDGAGQRLTASGTTKLDNLLVYPDELRKPRRGGAGGSRSPGTAFAQLFLAAVLAGIAANARSDAVGYARKHSRPIKHSSAARSVDDPYVQHAVGQIGALAFAAEAAVLRAAGELDRANDAGADNPRLLTDAAVSVAQAQFFAAEAALRSGELVFEAGSASATLREHNLDRHWRNARTVANHNPRAYKAAVSGAYWLNDTEPPSSLF